MGNIGTVFRFGGHYLRRYWTRFAAGVLLGILFGLTNASFVWATKVLMGRMAPAGAFVAPTISTSPAGLTVNQGNNVMFTVAAAGQSSPAYQWQREGTNVASASSSYTINNVQANDAGNYRVIVSNVTGSVTSAVAALTVNIPSSITAQPQHQTVKLTSNTTFSVTATGTLPLSYQSETNAARAVKSASGFTAKLKARAEKVTDRVVDPWLPRFGRTIDWQQFLGGLLFLPALVALRGFSGYLSSYCLAWVSERVVNDLRGDVLEKLSSFSLDFFNRSATGDLLTRVNGDTGMLQRCLSLGFGDLIKEPVTLLSLLAALCLMDWQLTLWAMLFVPLCAVPVIVLGRKIRKASTQGWNTNISQSNLLVEVLSGIRVVKAFGLEAMMVQRFRQMSRRVVHFAMKAVRAREQVNPIIETVSMLGLGLLVLYIVHEQRRIDDMVAYLMGLVLFYGPIKKLAGLHVLFQQTRVGVDRLTHILTEQPTVKEHPQARPVTGFRSAISFEDVSFSYGNAPVLQNIRLDIPRGQKLGVAGESGSGKSTLVNLVFRFYDPTAGVIRLDGLDLREARMSDLRSQMALVSQEIVLFNETVAENIAYGKPGATREEIEAAAKAAFAHDFILQMPQGYETLIGERGVTLSGGQRQRLAIARAFIRNAPLLVLDEATASLDSQAEAEVQAAIDRLEENRTVICVAHRLSTLVRMDRIIVLSQGRIVEHGSFKELLFKGSLFANMARRQGIQTER